VGRAGGRDRGRAPRDGSEIRRIVDENFYGRDPATGAFSPPLDRYFTITAGEQRYA
jgi:hypothetical protein